MWTLEDDLSQLTPIMWEKYRVIMISNRGIMLSVLRLGVVMCTFVLNRAIIGRLLIRYS